MKEWWKRIRRNYVMIADRSSYSAVDETRELLQPSLSSETLAENEVFEVVPEMIPEAAPRIESATSLTTLQAAAAVATELPARVPLSTELPPIPSKNAPSNQPSPLAKQTSFNLIDPFVRRRTKDSFQGSLESIDSLVESYWDPDEDGSLVTTNLVQSLDFLEEHVDFLKVQTQPRSVEVVWDTEDDVWGMNF